MPEISEDKRNTPICNSICDDTKPKDDKQSTVFNKNTEIEFNIMKDGGAACVIS